MVARLAPVALLALIVSACSAPDQTGGKDVLDSSTDTGGDVADLEVVIPPTDSVVTDIPTTSWKKPEGYAAIQFTVDDTANQTYKDGQMKWTGSFAWSAKDNTIAFSSAWQPTDGPFPALYDDGPWSAGGHEPEGAVKGDHLFQCEVWFKADEETTFEYGALNEFDRWIWLGPNGVFTLAKGATDTIPVPGLVFPGFGDIDFKVTVDLNALNPAFSSVTPADNKVYLKSSANSWTPVEIVDDGQKGDATAGDGVYTYVQSVNKGSHDGLIATDQHVQFVFVFAMTDLSPDEGSEYKQGTQCLADGVKAYHDAAAKGTFAEVPVVFERESRGKVFNTTFIAGDGGPWCLVDGDCFDPTGEGSVQCDTDKKSCGDGTVIPPVKSEPVIQMIDPNKGPMTGGTTVTLTGKDFRANPTVMFGDVAAATVSIVSDTEVTVSTPAHAKGLVTVVLTNTDGGTAEYPNGFEFVEQTGPNLADWGRLNPPLTVATDVGVDSEAVYGEVFEAGVTESGGGEGLVFAEAGWGPVGSTPDASWTWISADYDKASGNNAVFAAHLKPAAAGTFAFTFRFSVDGGTNWQYVDSDGLDNGFSASMLGTLTATTTDPDAPAVTTLSPSFGTTLGGTTVTANGKNLTGVTTVLIDGVEVAATAGSDTSFSFTTPKHAAGLAGLSFTNGAGKAGTKANAFAFVPKGTPTVDGDVGSDWDESWRVATNELAGDWGDANALTALYVAFDDANLYVGVQGKCQIDEANQIWNTIAVYVDRDYGAGTGASDMTSLTDTSIGIDDAVASKAKVTAAGFGAEVAVATKGMVSVAETGTDAGWRLLNPPGDFFWMTGEVKAGAAGFEAKVPLATFFSDAIPAAGANLAFLVRLVDKTGDYTSNAQLPQSFNAGDPWVSSSVAVVPYR